MVHFVGAGCGAVDLITVRGQRLLEQADVVIYAGSLVNPQLLEYTKAGCQIYNSAVMALPEILKVMIDMEKQGKQVVRLHTGDPSIYGAIREQMDALKEAGVEYEVCPGVSSLFGAAAALKAEYTLPEVSQTVIITRMAGRTGVPEKEQISLLASHQATMVIFLSTGLLDSLKEELLSGGYKENTPCAIVYKATWPEEVVVRGILKELPELAMKNNITKTALIVVGEFLGKDYELSKLYDPAFETEFRKASTKEV
ncbi:cobalt-precorrin-4 C(11)-methyltransferase [Anaerocolumna cellulosilytica]|uniref:Cobalt-precorrin-4 C(11)-methyltransferase n=1 Tax=Anaerocolumna cellulosilytica TaxID=433286 RepID=A0A6S6RA95_9FIRM|nr:precorrin-4 C(11)-methyltransferase [Anaerocolumna cellulosilytica]MBB5196372.1 precorrin-4/cobalt-precorrin-4 C11-methyltransferase [Anaerocolumna cellulosilytica]BCJ96400.1 cobalt-precorrin-4 C(11)-methyltransferase [Anaerocolumna cellulosilytica]